MLEERSRQLARAGQRVAGGMSGGEVAREEWVCTLRKEPNTEVSHPWAGCGLLSPALALAFLGSMAPPV